jgi:hypothetical protein
MLGSFKVVLAVVLEPLELEELITEAMDLLHPLLVQA